MYLSYDGLEASKSIFYLHKTPEQPKIRCVFLQHHPTEQQLGNTNTTDFNKTRKLLTEFNC